jgi:hypothetical protein
VQRHGLRMSRGPNVPQSDSGCPSHLVHGRDVGATFQEQEDPSVAAPLRGEVERRGAVLGMRARFRRARLLWPLVH